MKRRIRLMEGENEDLKKRVRDADNQIQRSSDEAKEASRMRSRITQLERTLSDR